MIELKSFSKLNPDQDIKCQAKAVVVRNEIQLHFAWQSKEPIEVETFRHLQRQDELWKKSCFEFFISSVERPSSYFEINLSTSGGWNVYEFQSYRSPQPPSPLLSAEVLKLESSNTVLQAQVRIPNLPTRWNASLCAILMTPKSKYYFSLAHKADKPDFHLRSSFILENTGDTL